MCLAVPGKVVEWLDRTEFFERASVEFAGIRRDVAMSFTPEAQLGDYVVVHAGVAISIIDSDDAQATLRDLAEMDQLSGSGERGT